VAVFGQKDFQQLKVIERMVRDLGLPVKVMGAPTLRADDGLALSSRNQYLSRDERELAPQIHATLLQMRELVEKGHAIKVVEQAAASKLARAGFEPDYTVIRRAEDLSEPAEGEREGLVALIAARLGKTRLIDNLPFD
jgi:pantoate--beta-alanine ligase